MYSGMTPKALEWQKKIRKFVNDELIPLFFTATTTPSKACMRSLLPSLTFTETTTVSPLEKSGVSLICFAEISSTILVTFLFLMFSYKFLE